jgi:hypothetical protein
VTVLVLAAVTVLVFAVANDPVRWAKQRWYDVTGKTTPLEVEVRVVGTTAPQFPLSGLTDGDPRTAWATPRPPGAAVSAPCGGIPGQGRIHLSWNSPARIREVQVQAGLDAAESGRDAQPLPRRLDFTFPDGSPDGRCVSVYLDNSPDMQTKKLDTEIPVTSLDVAVGAIVPKTAERPDQVVSLSELQLRIRPR